MKDSRGPEAHLLLSPTYEREVGMERSVQEYIGLIHRIASKFYPTFRNDPAIGFEDLVAEGFHVFCDLIDREKQTSQINCKFTTALHRALHHRYIDLARKSKSAKGRQIRVPFEDNLSSKHHLLIEALALLSKEGRELAETIINAPSELLDCCSDSASGMTKKGLARYLSRYRKWEWQLIQKYLRRT